MESRGLRINKDERNMLISGLSLGIQEMQWSGGHTLSISALSLIDNVQNDF